MKIDIYNLYDKLATNPLELADKDQPSNNDAKFADPNKFKKELNSQFYATKKNLLQSGKEKKTYESIIEKTPAKNAENDNDLTFSCILDHIDFFNDK